MKNVIFPSSIVMGNASDPFMAKINPPASLFAQRVHSSTKKKEEAISKRTMYEVSKREHRLFKVIAPWKWPFPWRRPGRTKVRPGGGGSP